MKTIKERTGLKILTYSAIMLFLFFTSCKDNDKIDFDANDNSNLQSESNSEAQLEDVSDMGSVAVSSDAGTLSGGKTGETAGNPRNITISDTRFACATVTLEFAADNVPGSVNPPVVANPHGTITIDFGNGCTGPNGRVRKGKILIEFKGRRFLPGSYVILSFANFSVDGIKVEGTRTETNASESLESAPKFNIVELDMKVTYTDGTFATRNSTRTRTWIRKSNPLEDEWTVTGEASGVTRKAKDYVMTITKALKFKRACAISSKVVIPVEGTKELVVDGKKITLDFGSGECDTKLTITVNGKSKEVEVSANGN